MDDISEKTQALNARFEALIVFLDETNAKTIEGKSIDLKDLDKTVSALCFDTENAPPEVAKNVQPLMASMITKLDELAENIKTLKRK